MIRMIDSARIPAAQPWENQLLRCYLEMNAAISGPGIRREFWICENHTGTGAWICRSPSAVWCSAARNASKETVGFLQMLEIPSLETDGQIASQLSDTAFEKFEIMCLKLMLRDLEEENMQLFWPGDAAAARLVTEIHEQAGFFVSRTAAMDFYAELHLRLRRGVAAAAVLLKNGMPVSCAALGAIGEQGAVISHVCTVPQYRTRGLGRKTAAAACSMALSLSKTPMLACESTLVSFYSSIGFACSGQKLLRLRKVKTDFTENLRKIGKGADF